MNKDEILDAFLSGYDVLKIPVIENGKPVWEEKFPIEKIEQLKKSVGAKKFSSQMMLCPVDVSEGRFDIEKLSFYNSEIKREERKTPSSRILYQQQIDYASFSNFFMNSIRA